MKYFCCLILSLIILPGCSNAPRFQWPQPLPLGANLAAYIPPADLETAPGSGRPDRFSEPRTLTLPAALAAALLHNFELKTHAWEIRAAEARTLQASMPPNPEAGIEVENLGGTSDFRGLEGAETTFSISQPIVLADKVRTRTRIASLDRTLSAFDYESARVDVLTAVTIRFIRVLGGQKRVALATRLHHLAAEVFDVVAKRVEVGDLSPVEQTHAGITVATTNLELKKAHRDLTVSRLHLAALWSSTTPAFQTAAGQLDDIPTQLPAASDLVALISQNPEIARWAVEISKRQTTLALARAHAVPDVTIKGGLRYMNPTSDRALMVGLDVPLPFFDRHQGDRLEAAYNIQKASETRQASELRVRTALAIVYERLSGSHAAILDLRDTILPEARTAFEKTKRALEQGALGYRDVLDAQRQLIHLESEYLEVLMAFHVARSELERLIAQPLTGGSLSSQEGVLP